jgi:hypothetical protein
VNRSAAAAQAETNMTWIDQRVWNKRLIPVLVFVVGSMAAYALLATTQGFVSTDDYYHSRIAAQIIEQRALRLHFPWLPLTILSHDQFVDHHLLYHIYLAPWEYWGGIIGAKLAQALVFGGICLAFWSLLRRLQVRYAVLWTAALFGVSTPFIYRALMVRTQAAAVLLLLVALHLLVARRDRWLVVLAFAFAWLYDGFVLLPIVVTLYGVASWIADREFNWKPVVYTLFGTLLGLCINPYFPENVVFITSHLGEKFDIASNIRVGTEWYPYTTAVFLENSLGAFLALVAGLLAPSFRKTGRDRVETATLLMALLTLFMTFQSRRFVEYFPAFALLFGAVAWGRGGIQWRSYLPKFVFKPSVARLQVFVLALPVFILVYITWNSVRADIQNGENADYMAGAARWLQTHTEPGTMIFQTDWDDFPYLFYLNTQNTYLIGLDPTYLEVAHPELWNQWVSITQGAVENPSSLIRDGYGATYVVSDTQHDAFAARADQDPAMQLVYRDSSSMIWQIVTSSP